MSFVVTAYGGCKGMLFLVIQTPAYARIRCSALNPKPESSLMCN